MSRIAVPNLEDVPEGSKEGLAAVYAQLGVVPNLFRLIASSPAALTGFLNFSGALKKTLDVKTRERIALAVAQVNGCDYCLSAHTFLATNLSSARRRSRRIATAGPVTPRRTPRSHSPAR